MFLVRDYIIYTYICSTPNRVLRRNSEYSVHLIAFRIWFRNHFCSFFKLRFTQQNTRDEEKGKNVVFSVNGTRPGHTRFKSTKLPFSRISFLFAPPRISLFVLIRVASNWSALWSHDHVIMWRCCVSLAGGTGRFLPEYGEIQNQNKLIC